MSVIDEPVRGSIPPPWWWSLSGLERIQALARGQIPRPPLSRLLDIRAGHIGPAFCTWTMPATGWLVGLPELEISLFVEAALTSTAMTAVGPAHTIEPLQLAVNRFRPVRAAAGNLVARCRVINASRFFIYTEAESKTRLADNCSTPPAMPKFGESSPTRRRSPRNYGKSTNPSTQPRTPLSALLPSKPLR